VYFTAPLPRRERKRETKLRKARNRTRRIHPTRKTQRGMTRGKECHPRTMKIRKNRLENTLTIGASTIWHGQSTSLLTANWA
jgi:hypothetical protein